MALLSEKGRKRRLELLGYTYDKDGILKFQKKAFPKQKSQQDSEYGFNTDRALRHFYNVKKCAPSFEPQEFRCTCGHCTGYPSYMKQVELRNLQKIRDHYDRPMIVTSGLRCQYDNNRSAGSIKNSLHLVGRACDFYMAGVTDTLAHRKSFIKWAKKLPNTHYIYGNGINSNGYSVYAPYMGNAVHYDVNKATNTKPEEKVSQIAILANEFAYPTNTSKADYPKGEPKKAYKDALPKAYPNHNSWGTAPSKGASCDVFVGTCVRLSGIDKNFPRGLDEQIPYLQKSNKFREVKVTTTTVKDGDIIVYAKTGGGAHICIAYGGKIKEAGYKHYYPKTTNYLKQRLSKSGKKWLRVYRVR